MLARLAEGGLEGRLVAHVEGSGLRDASLGADGSCGGVQFLLFPARQRDAGAVLREPLGDPLADPAAASGHKGDAAFEQTIAEDARHDGEE